MISEKENESRIRELCDTYRDESQIGLVTGAGVSRDSGVPLYKHMAYELLHGAYRLRLLKKGKKNADIPKLLSAMREWIETGKPPAALSPADVAHLVSTRLADVEPRTLVDLLRFIIYDPSLLMAGGQRVTLDAAQRNPTPSSILTFCAALDPEDSKARPANRIRLNTKVGGILTTNYDFLLEACFTRKFRLRGGLSPVGRVGSAEHSGTGSRIPVYHIHGCIHYKRRQGDKPSDIVITQEDYFDVFHDNLGFGNFIGMNFLHRFPSLFIGLSMEDENLRRYLARIKRELRGRKPRPRYFALFKKNEDNREDDYMDAVLDSYGVRTIWMKDYKEIPHILERVYTFDHKNQKAATAWQTLFGYWYRGGTVGPDEMLRLKPVKRDCKYFDAMWNELAKEGSDWRDALRRLAGPFRSSRQEQ